MTEEEPLLIRIHGDPKGRTLVYMPGIHGDWSMGGDFRRALIKSGKDLCYVEFTYPRTVKWTMEQYGRAVFESLVEHGITHGWILAESFGSQIAWKVIELDRREPGRFTPEGLILAGGFVQHQPLCGFRFLGKEFRWGPKTHFKVLRWFGRRIFKRCRRDPLVMKDLSEFKARRSQLDRDAVMHRLKIIAGNDPRPVAAETTFPVYCMGGLIDLAVLFPHTRYWLWRHCPGYRDGHLMLNWSLRDLGSDHHVMGRGERAFNLVWNWMERG